MTERPIPAIVYGVKSSPDEKESVADQHRIVLEAIEREGGRRVVGTYGEANQSGYRKERGPELERAMQAARDEAAEHGAAELWVFHSSRLARGDGRKGRRGLGKVVFDLLYDDVTVRSVTDAEMVTPMLAGIAGKANHEYSAALSAHTARGIGQRKRAGKAFGAIPTGYKAVQVTNPDGTAQTIGNRIVTERVIDPLGAKIIERMAAGIEAGETPGDIAKDLNAIGARSSKGNAWTRETVREALQRSLYMGEQGYPRLIEPERWERLQELLQATSPAAEQRRKGGRKPKVDGFLLRGLAFCAHCGEPMHLRSDRSGYYGCRNKRRGTGLCGARAIPAPLLDQRVLDHLDTFLASVEGWLADQLVKRDDERMARQTAVDAAKAAVARLDIERDKLLSEYRRLVSAGDPLAKYALEPIADLDAEQAARERDIADAQGRPGRVPVDPRRRPGAGLLPRATGRHPRPRERFSDGRRATRGPEHHPRRGVGQL